MNIYDKKFYLILGLIFAAEAASFAGFFLPAVNSVGLVIIIAAVLAASLYRLEYGLLAVLAELFIGSKGYLFSLSIFDTPVSVRMALWLTVMAVWFGQALFRSFKAKRPDIAILQSNFRWPLLLLSIFILWGVANALIRGRGFDLLFFDLNGWLYLALIFPVYDVYADWRKKNGLVQTLLQVFHAAAIWLAFKSFWLLFAFSHADAEILRNLYRWVRDTGVGEITAIQGGFYRIFFQSHVYAIVALFLCLIPLIAVFLSSDKGIIHKFKTEFRTVVLSGFFLSVFAAVNLLSFSRSNWAGLIFGLAVFLIWLARTYRLKTALAGAVILLISFIIGFGLLTFTVVFPFPSPIGGFSTSNLLSERASRITGEAGASSRWALLPELLGAIKTSPLAGQGFGATVTYRTSDPRQLELNPEGLYTTYAFEWGWLDIALKLGLFGLGVYFYLLFVILRAGALKTLPKAFSSLHYLPNTHLGSAFLFGLITLVAINIFSPYFNHPLGFGFLMITAVLVDNSISKTRGI